MHCAWTVESKGEIQILTNNKLNITSWINDFIESVSIQFSVMILNAAFLATFSTSQNRLIVNISSLAGKRQYSGDLNNGLLEVWYTDHRLFRCSVPITYQARK